MASTDVVEQEVLDQIKDIDRLKADLEALHETVPLFGMTILIYEDIKRRIQEKLNDLHMFNAVSSSNYDTALELADRVAQELAQVQDANHFIEGDYNHKNKEGQPNGYWIKNGKRIREPNREGFAEYFGRIMVPEGKSKEAGLKSIEEFLPGSKEFMDRILNEMNER